MGTQAVGGGDKLDVASYVGNREAGSAGMHERLLVHEAPWSGTDWMSDPKRG